MDLALVSKAIAGAIVTAVVAYLAKHGVALDPVVKDAVDVIFTTIVSGAAGFVVVFFAPKNKTVPTVTIK